MSKTAVITARLDPETLAGLDEIAVRQDRSRAYLVSQAVKYLVDEERAFSAMLDEADAQIDRGEFHTQEEMEAWARSLDRADRA